MALEYDPLVMGLTSPTPTDEEVVAVLEARARCLEEVLLELEPEILGFTQARSGLEWTGLAALQFSFSADELTAVLQQAVFSLGEGLRSSRWAAASVSDGSGG